SFRGYCPAGVLLLAWLPGSAPGQADAVKPTSSSTARYRNRRIESLPPHATPCSRRRLLKTIGPYRDRREGRARHGPRQPERRGAVRRWGCRGSLNRISGISETRPAAAVKGLLTPVLNRLARLLPPLLLIMSVPAGAPGISAGWLMIN